VGAHDSSLTFLVLVFVGILVLAAIFLSWAVFDKRNKGKFTTVAARQYGEDMNTVIELTAKDMVPRFPHLGTDEVTELVIARLSARSGNDAKLYAFTVRQVVARLKGESLHGTGTAAPGAPGDGITHWTD
jgi:hypothetical protein